ncbi:hypothetical protein ACRQ1B_28400 [Rhizobium panacihumi]|uniref:hypothetical protein n=1 Tax=Rhizobium panacihumi TaxID=2008450 RepID=UPI003D7BD9EB
MTVVGPLVENPIADWISRKVYDRLSGRALACAVNARNHLVRAQKIADISETISFFCATHATEGAVACFVAAAKASRYPDLAKKINVRDHAQKIVLASYVQIIADQFDGAGLSVGHDPGDDTLLARVRKDEGDKIYPLGLHLFSFNEDCEDPSHAAAHEAFMSRFPNPIEMVGYIYGRASDRDNALYAKDGGAPALSRERLDVGLKEHTLLTLGLIWAAIDVTYHEEPEPFVVQVLGAVEEVINEVRPLKTRAKHG